MFRKTLHEAGRRLLALIFLIGLFVAPAIVDDAHAAWDGDIQKAVVTGDSVQADAVLSDTSNTYRLFRQLQRFQAGDMPDSILANQVTDAWGTAGDSCAVSKQFYWSEDASSWWSWGSALTVGAANTCVDGTSPIRTSGWLPTPPDNALYYRWIDTGTDADNDSIGTVEVSLYPRRN